MGLNSGTDVDHPVPIPSAPLTSTIGIIGTYQTGSIFNPSSTLYNNKLSSFSINIFLVIGFKFVKIYLALAAPFIPLYLVPNCPKGNNKLILLEPT